MDHVQHDRPVTEVERHIVAEHAAGCHQHRALEPPLLDVTVTDAHAGKSLPVTLHVRPQAAILDDSPQVVYVRNVVDRWHRSCRLYDPPSPSGGAASSLLDAPRSRSMST